MPKLIPNTAKQEAVHLRQLGYSQNELVRIFGISKSTASLWTSNVQLDSKAKQILNEKRLCGIFKTGNTMWQRKKNFHRSLFWTTEKIEQLKSLYSTGLSIRETSAKLGATLNSTVSIMRRRQIPMRKASETRKTMFYNSPLSFNSKVDLTASENILKAAGLMLYWGEGAKSHDKVDFANSNPNMVRLFIKFLRQLYRVSENRLRGHLFCFDDQDLNELTNFWSNLTKIPVSRFIKPYVRAHIESKHAKIKFGVFHVIYSDKRLLQLLLNDINFCYNSL